MGVGDWFHLGLSSQGGGWLLEAMLRGHLMSTCCHLGSPVPWTWDQEEAQDSSCIQGEGGQRSPWCSHSHLLDASFRDGGGCPRLLSSTSLFVPTKALIFIGHLLLLQVQVQSLTQNPKGCSQPWPPHTALPALTLGWAAPAPLWGLPAGCDNGKALFSQSPGPRCHFWGCVPAASPCPRMTFVCWGRGGGSCGPVVFP